MCNNLGKQIVINVKSGDVILDRYNFSNIIFLSLDEQHNGMMFDLSLDEAKKVRDALDAMIKSVE